MLVFNGMATVRIKGRHHAAKIEKRRKHSRFPMLNSHKNERKERKKTKREREKDKKVKGKKAKSAERKGCRRPAKGLLPQRQRAAFTMPKGSSYNAKGLLSRPFRKAAAEGGDGGGPTVGARRHGHRPSPQPLKIRKINGLSHVRLRIS